MCLRNRNGCRANKVCADFLRTFDTEILQISYRRLGYVLIFRATKILGCSFRILVANDSEEIFKKIAFFIRFSYWKPHFIRDNHIGMFHAEFHGVRNGCILQFLCVTFVQFRWELFIFLELYFILVSLYLVSLQFIIPCIKNRYVLI